MGFLEGVKVAHETGDVGTNPFGVVLSAFNKAQIRRFEEDRKRKDEEAQLKDALTKLGMQHEYDTELERQKSLMEGKIEPTTETGQGTFELPGPFGAIGKRYKAGGSPDLMLKQENLKYMQNINKKMGEGGGTDLIARRADTGEEVDLPTAQAAIAQGDRNYIINQKQTTKAGIKETPLIKAPDLTSEEKNYIVASKRITSSVNDLLGRFDQIYDKKGSAGWKQYQVQGLPFFAIGDQNLQYFKSSLNKLKGDIPFLRGGKQLTPMEAKRIDILLNPFGKTKETYRKDLEQFKTEFMSGAEVMVGGVSALSRQQGQGQKQGGQIMIDAQGNKAMVYPDGSYEEVK